MDKHVLLVFNMGNSGGKYFEDICNSHDDVQVWQEANHFLHVETIENRYQLDAVFGFFMAQYENNPKKTIGLIKAFDDRLIRFAEDKGGSIIQMFRHPIGVVHFKTGHKMVECKRRGLFDKLDTPEKIFEAHVEFYASVYQAYIDNAYKWPIVKLEDLKKSLREDSFYFEETMKKSLKVDWLPKHTKKVIGMGGLEENYSHFGIWESWAYWKKRIFLKYFQRLMRLCQYEWER